MHTCLPANERVHAPPAVHPHGYASTIKAFQHVDDLIALDAITVAAPRSATHISPKPRGLERARDTAPDWSRRLTEAMRMPLGRHLLASVSEVAHQTPDIDIDRRPRATPPALAQPVQSSSSGAATGGRVPVGAERSVRAGTTVPRESRPPMSAGQDDVSSCRAQPRPGAMAPPVLRARAVATSSRQVEVSKPNQEPTESCQTPDSFVRGSPRG